MKTIIFFCFFFLVFFSLYSQIDLRKNDIIVIKKDTLKCKIIENGMDTVVFSIIDNKTILKSNKEILVKDILYYKWQNINFLQFSRNSEDLHSTQELMGKFDFSHRKLWNFYIQVGNNVIQAMDTTNNRIFWMGLDFSKVKIKLGIAPRTQYSEPFFKDCNDFLLSEKGLISYMINFNFIIDTGIVTNRNSKINFSNIYNRPANILPIDSIRVILKGLKTVHEGIGLIIFVTEMNKETELITFYLTFFDIQSKAVLLCLKETGQAGGVGMAKHWTKPIIEFSNDLIKKNNWKKRYSIKN